MKQPAVKLTTSQFAKIHGVNKRTLHYYDAVGLFSPNCKDSKNYRYYDCVQGMQFEYIRMLKEMNMSIKEIKEYMNSPNEDDFLCIADEKLKEIDHEIARLKRAADVLRHKKNRLELCRDLKDGEIKIFECEEEYFHVIPLRLEDYEIEQIYTYLKDSWNTMDHSFEIGSYISVDKIQAGNFEDYDGLFIPAQKASGKEILKKPKGTYICGFMRGSWNRLPDFYKKIMTFAEERSLKLTGNAFETGLNDFAISSADEYVTQIMIRTENPDRKRR